MLREGEGEEVKASSLVVDYLLCPTELLLDNLPPFLVGYDGWINWVVAQYLRVEDTPLIDASKVIRSVGLRQVSPPSPSSLPSTGFQSSPLSFLDNQSEEAIQGQQLEHFQIPDDHNIKLAQADLVDVSRLGFLGNCEYRFVPLGEGCPECRLEKVPYSLDVMLFKFHKKKDIIVATVEPRYLAFALNWACSLKRLGIENFFFHTTEDKVVAELSERLLPVFKYPSESEKGSSGSVSGHALLDARISVVTAILERGYNVLLSDIDIVFLRNPFFHFEPQLDLQGGAQKDNKITSGFIYTRASPHTREVWSKMQKEHAHLLLKKDKFSKFTSGMEKDLLSK